MGQFDDSGAERLPERIAEPHLVPRPQLRRNVHNQAHPSAAMVDDHYPVVSAKWARKADDAVGGSADLGSARRREADPARADAAIVDGAKTLEDRRRYGQNIAERR